MMVKLAPFLATILCLWLGKLAIPVLGKLEGGGGAGATTATLSSITGGAISVMIKVKEGNKERRGGVK